MKFAWSGSGATPAPSHKETPYVQNGQQRRWCTFRHSGRKFLGEGPAKSVFWCKDLQPYVYTKPLNELLSSVFQKAAEKWKEESIWKACMFKRLSMVHLPLLVGCMGPTATFLPYTSLLAKKPYSHTVHWLRCRLSFSLIDSTIMCLQGSHSNKHHASNSAHNIDFTCCKVKNSLQLLLLYLTICHVFHFGFMLVLYNICKQYLERKGFRDFWHC